MKLQFDDAVDVVMGTCKNISIGGMQVISDEPRPEGTLVRFEVEIEEGVTIRGLGEVVWMRTENLSLGEPGMGIKFRFIEQRDRQMIYKLVSEHIKERLAQKHPAADGAELPAPAAAAPPVPVPETATSPPAAAAPDPTPSFGEAPTVALDRPAETPTVASADLDESFLSIAGHPVGSPMPSEAETPGPFDGADYELPAGDGTEAELPSYDDSGGGMAYRADDLYHPRVARRRGVPVVPLVIVLLLAGVAVVYLNWDRILGPPAPTTTPESTGAQVPPPTSPPGAETQPSPAESPTPDLSKPGTPERIEPPPPPAPPAPAPPPPTPAANRSPFSRVVDISWTRRPGGVKIEITDDGAIADDRFSHFRLAGENPREIVKLKGVVRQYSPNEISLSGAPVSRIRVGYHPGPKELHVVLDILDPATAISGIRAQGNKLEVYLD